MNSWTNNSTGNAQWSPATGGNAEWTDASGGKASWGKPLRGLTWADATMTWADLGDATWEDLAP